MRRVRKFNPPDLFLTLSESALVSLTSLVALILSLATARWLIVVAAPVWAFGIYRSQRRLRAARRAGLNGFVSQAPRVGDEERERKVAAIRRELGDWRPGLRWLEEVDARAAGRYG